MAAITLRPVPAVGDLVVITASQSYAITLDDDGDLILEMEGVLVHVDARDIAANRAADNHDRTPYRVRTADDRLVWAADVRLLDDAAQAEHDEANAKADQAELAALRGAFNALRSIARRGDMSEATRQEINDLLEDLTA